MICVLWAQMKLCMRALALCTSLSEFHLSQGVVFTFKSDDIWSVIRKKSLVCIHISVQRVEQVFPRTRPVPVIGHTMHTHTQVPDGCPPAWWISHKADSNEKKDNCAPSTAEPCSSCQP